MGDKRMTSKVSNDGWDEWQLRRVSLLFYLSPL